MRREAGADRSDSQAPRVRSAGAVTAPEKQNAARRRRPLQR
ncbi:hypothetical protein LG3211_5317 [Lysobacter gummosus]|nr:hypothetical protein LG3211_5317 [Lysobacter gummosus]